MNFWKLVSNYNSNQENKPKQTGDVYLNNIVSKLCNMYQDVVFFFQRVANKEHDCVTTIVFRFKLLFDAYKIE